MDWSTSVLTRLSSDTEPTIIFTFHTGKYIFNIGENTNRAFLQSQSNWKRTRGLFFTDISTKRCTGLPGLLMSFADATIPRLHIVGPPGLLHYMASMRFYTYRDSLNISPVEASWTTSAPPEPLFQDPNITVYGIPIIPVSGPSNAHNAADSTTEASQIGQKRKRSVSPEVSEKRLVLDNTSTPSSKSQIPPSELEGEAADEWRRQLIQIMFPGTKVKPEKAILDRDNFGRRPPKVKGRGSGSVTPSEISASDEPTANVDPYRRPRLPFGYHNQLPKFVRHTLASFSSPTPTLAYVVVGPRIRGKFNVKAAEALGVPSGPLRAQLTRGNSVTIQTEVDGQMVERVVRPEDCIGESEAPGVAIILDIPTAMHIPQLITAFNDPFYAKFRSHRPEDFKENAVRSVFHLLGKGVLEDPRYIEFMNGFSSDTHHVISSRDHSPDPVTFTSVALSQLRMNQLDSHIFPLPHYSLQPKYNFQAIPNIPKNSILLTAGLEFDMRRGGAPTGPLEVADSFHTAMKSDKPVTLPQETKALFDKAKKDVEEHIVAGKLSLTKGSNVKVIPLGTGSAVPSKYRNVSSTLIQIPKWGNILLDAGEGTWGQLVRQFGLNDTTPNNVWDVLRDLKCIYVSHIHGDHHMGLAYILSKRKELNPPPSCPLYLVTIRLGHLYLRELHEIQDLGFDDPSGNGVVPVMSESLHWKNTGYQTQGMWQIGGNESWTEIGQSRRNARAMCDALGLKSFTTVDVRHRTRCYGVVIKHKDDWSVVFSGDTQPSHALATAGEDATLLIHEATMANDQEEMALQKAHSTFGQALDVGRRMRAKHVLLTHFSARYPKMPPGALQRSPRGELQHPVVALAFDHANFKIGDMWKASYYVRALEESFRATVMDEGDEDEEAEAEAKAMAGMDVALG